MHLTQQSISPFLGVEMHINVKEILFLTYNKIQIGRKAITIINEMNLL